jgi:DNA-binding MarR family transcriptional regulator
MDRAERRGIARRSSVPGDRRALQATLTDAGRRAAVAFHAEVNAELSGLTAPPAPHDREHFRRAVAEVIAAAGPSHLGSAR